MKRQRNTPEQIIRKLRVAEQMVSEGKSIGEAAKALEVSAQTLHRWRNQYGGMKAADARRLKELEKKKRPAEAAGRRQGARSARPEGDRQGKLPSPARRRRAVLMLVDRLGLSERRACRFAGQNRSTRRHRPQVAEVDAALRRRLRKVSEDRPRWGYRRAHAHQLNEGFSLNRKRVQRIWREEGLRAPPKPKKRLRLGDSTVPADRLRAEYPNHVWALDYQHDATSDGRALKFLNVLDEFTREALAIEVDRSIDAEQTVAVLARLAAKRGAPANLRADNGPELTAAVLREWCRLGKTGTAYIEPGSPWQNAYGESFNSRLPSAVFDYIESFYNRERRHSTLGYLSPREYEMISMDIEKADQESKP